MIKPFIELKNLCKSYTSSAGEYNVLHDINLTINTGEFVALMGPSGSGKSTLMHILGCLDIPTSGDYFLAGQNVSHLNNDTQAKLRNRVIGFVFQGYNLLPRITLEHNVFLPLFYARADVTASMKQAHELLDKVGLGKRYKALPTEISGGEQQRVAIARALANKPQLLLADEPTGNLDSVSSKMIMDIFKSLHQEGMTVFLVTHDVDVASYAARKVKLLDGKIVEDTYV